MANRESFENLIEGLAGAVVEAQRRIESRQLLNVLRYLDNQRHPKIFDIRVPSTHPMAEDYEDVVYKVPLLPLIANSSLRIKEVEVQFDADLIGIEGDKDDEAAAGQADSKDSKGAKIPKGVSVDIRGGICSSGAPARCMSS